MQLGEEEPRHAPVVRLASTFPWRSFDRKSEELVNAQGESGGRNCEQCCSAATTALADLGSPISKRVAKFLEKITGADFGVTVAT
jgi:hypothetical protein